MWISSSSPVSRHCWIVWAPCTPTDFGWAADLAWATALSMPSVTNWTVEPGRGQPSGTWWVTTNAGTSHGCSPSQPPALSNVRRPVSMAPISAIKPLTWPALAAETRNVMSDLLLGIEISTSAEKYQSKTSSTPSSGSATNPSSDIDMIATTLAMVAAPFEAGLFQRLGRGTRIIGPSLDSARLDENIPSRASNPEGAVRPTGEWPPEEAAGTKEAVMARYLISFDDGWMTFPREELPDVAKDALEVVHEAQEAGVWVYGAGLESQRASIVATNGTVTDGPFPETKEIIGGFAIVDVPSREGALEWAAKIAVACRCAQEVRELLPDPPALEQGVPPARSAHQPEPARSEAVRRGHGRLSCAARSDPPGEPYMRG